MPLKEYDNYKKIDITKDDFPFRVKKTADFTDELIMGVTIDVSRKSKQERGETILEQPVPQPKIGAALIHDEWVYFSARSGMKTGDHAEYTVLESVLPKGEDTSNDTLFTTLEPCTQEARSEWSESCSRLIVNKRIKRIFIGTVDANPLITGMGIRYLLENGVDVLFYPPSFTDKLKEINNSFFAFFDGFSDFKSIRLIHSYLKNDLDFDVVNLYLEKLKQNNCGTIDGLFYFYREMLKEGYLGKGDALNPVTITPDFALVFFKEPNKIIHGYQIDFLGDNFKLNRKPFKGSVIKALNDKLEGSIYWTISKNYGQSQLFKEQELARELITNAIAHNNYRESATINLHLYSDRVEICNCITSDWSDDDLIKLNKGGALSIPRNPMLMDLLETFGIVEHHGYGNRENISTPSKVDTYKFITQTGLKLLVTTLPFKSKGNAKRSAVN